MHRHLSSGVRLAEAPEMGLVFNSTIYNVRSTSQFERQQQEFGHKELHG